MAAAEFLEEGIGPFDLEGCFEEGIGPFDSEGCFEVGIGQVEYLVAVECP